MTLFQRQELYNEAEKALTVDGEPVYNLTTNLEFLYMATIILNSRENFQNLQVKINVIFNFYRLSSDIVCIICT